MKASGALAALLWLSSPSPPASDDLVRHLAHLASDGMEGRAPGTPGAGSAARYIAAEFEATGLEPVGGSYFQSVPLVGITADASRGLLVPSVPRDAFVLTSESEAEEIDFTAPVVEVGYGIVCPAAGWDDYDRVDVVGELVAVHPGLPDPKESRFPGGRFGRYARDAHKLEQARAHGARGVIFLLEEDARETIVAKREWLRHETLRRQGLENPLDAIVWIDAAHIEPPEVMGIRHRQRTRRFDAPNVIGVLPGVTRDEAVVVTAHYDAYGIGPEVDSGDAIYNGALDNASGTAALIELARRFSERETPPTRTLVFIATTAEEHGALGMEYYVEHPVVPLEKTVAALNLDGINLIAPTEDFIVFPSEGIAADEALGTIGRIAGMTPTIESWQRGMHFSFDTKAFLKRGVVAITLWQGSSYELPEIEVAARRSRFGAIHTPGDEWRGWADDEAIEQHLKLYTAAIEVFANAATRPKLSTPNPFF